MVSRIVNLFKKNERFNNHSLCSLSDELDNVLQLSRTVDELRPLLRPLMAKASIPEDQIDRLTQGSFDPLDKEKHQELLMACFGRLEHLQAIGSCSATLIAKKLESMNITLPITHSNINVSDLALEGSVSIPPLVNELEIQSILHWFKMRPCFNGHTPDAAQDRVHRYVGHTADEHVFGSYTTLDVALAPHLLEAILSNKILECATQHLGCIPTLSALQAWWNFPGHEENVVPGNGVPCYYHRDLNDLRMFWVYLYLTEVGEDNGPHMIIRHSSDINVIAERLQSALHNFPWLRSKLEILTPRDFFYQYGYQIPREVIDHIFTDLEVSLKGNAGTSFFSNGFNFHRIKYPLKRRRLMFAARFSINPSINESISRDGDPIPSDLLVDRIGDSPLIRYVTRKLIDYRPRL